MSAVISECGRYRYSLTRWWGDGLSTVCWIMLNPSTADASEDDPTIRRCIGFSKAWGYSGLEVVNLYAYRATNPKALASVVDPIGPDNAHAIREAADRASIVVCAWGSHGSKRGPLVRTEIPRSLFHLGLNRDGSPKHPLYIRGDKKPQLWEATR